MVLWVLWDIGVLGIIGLNYKIKSDLFILFYNLAVAFRTN